MFATTDILNKAEKYYMYSDLTINTKKKQRLVIVHSDNLFFFSIFPIKICKLCYFYRYLSCNCKPLDANEVLLDIQVDCKLFSLLTYYTRGQWTLVNGVLILFKCQNGKVI